MPAVHRGRLCAQGLEIMRIARSGCNEGERLKKVGRKGKRFLLIIFGWSTSIYIGIFALVALESNPHNLVEFVRFPKSVPFPVDGIVIN